MKRCSRCKELKPNIDFNRRKGASDGLRSECKGCGAKAAARYRQANKSKIAEIQRQYRKKNKVVVAAKDRAKNFWIKYGLTVEAWDALLASQNGCCAICFRSIEEIGQDKLHVDHDHVTSKVRGLLCNKCNIGLGYFDDDVLRLQQATRYLMN